MERDERGSLPLQFDQGFLERTAARAASKLSRKPTPLRKPLPRIPQPDVVEGGGEGDDADGLEQSGSAYREEW